MEERRFAGRGERCQSSSLMYGISGWSSRNRRLEDVRQHDARLVGLLGLERGTFAAVRGACTAEDRLRDLEVPVAEVVPEEAVRLVGRLVDAERGVAFVADCNRLAELRDDPFVEEAQVAWVTRHRLPKVAQRRERRSGAAREERLRVDGVDCGRGRAGSRSTPCSRSGGSPRCASALSAMRLLDGEKVESVKRSASAPKAGKPVPMVRRRDRPS